MNIRGRDYHGSGGTAESGRVASVGRQGAPQYSLGVISKPGGI